MTTKDHARIAVALRRASAHERVIGDVCLALAEDNPRFKWQLFVVASGIPFDTRSFRVIETLMTNQDQRGFDYFSAVAAVEAMELEGGAHRVNGNAR